MSILFKHRINWTYALGEVFLIFIGITLAIAFNNWNEGRKEKQAERQLMENLKTEYHEVIAQIETLNALRERMLTSIETFHEMMASGKISHDDHYLDSLLAITLLNPTFNGGTGAQLNLFAAGKIDLITNPELKKQLIEWPSIVEDMTEDEDRLLRTYHEAYFPLLSEYVAIYDVLREIEYRNLQFSTFGKATVKKDYRSMFRDPRFENLLSQRNVLVLVGLEAANITVEKAREIISLIEQELR